MTSNVRLGGTNSILIRKHQGGFVAEGPGFYIWDEDPTEVLRVARELGRGHYVARPTTRFLIVDNGSAGSRTVGTRGVQVGEASP